MNRHTVEPLISGPLSQKVNPLKMPSYPDARNPVKGICLHSYDQQKKHRQSLLNTALPVVE
jgi:hypothetical protein